MAGKEGMQAREVSVQSVQEVTVNFAGWGCPVDFDCTGESFLFLEDFCG